MERVTIENREKVEFECVGFLVYAQSSMSKGRGLWPSFLVSPKRLPSFLMQQCARWQNLSLNALWGFI